MSPGASEEVQDGQEVQETGVQESALDLLSEEATQAKLPPGSEDCSQGSQQDGQH